MNIFYYYHYLGNINIDNYVYILFSHTCGMLVMNLLLYTNKIIKISSCMAVWSLVMTSFSPLPHTAETAGDTGFDVHVIGFGSYYRPLHWQAVKWPLSLILNDDKCVIINKYSTVKFYWRKRWTHLNKIRYLEVGLHWSGGNHHDEPSVFIQTTLKIVLQGYKLNHYLPKTQQFLDNSFQNLQHLKYDGYSVSANASSYLVSSWKPPPYCHSSGVNECRVLIGQKWMFTSIEYRKYIRITLGLRVFFTKEAEVIRMPQIARILIMTSYVESSFGWCAIFRKLLPHPPGYPKRMAALEMSWRSVFVIASRDLNINYVKTWQHMKLKLAHLTKNNELNKTGPIWKQSIVKWRNMPWYTAKSVIAHTYRSVWAYLDHFCLLRTIQSKWCSLHVVDKAYGF